MMAEARGEFSAALESRAGAFGLALDARQVSRLAQYHDLVRRWSARLHLVAPCTPAEFAARHVLESLAALGHLPPGARVADVGAGAGLPSIPCLVAREDLRAALVEASAKKAVFLREALHTLGLKGRAEVINSRFEDTAAPAVDAVTCRALEQFSEVLPELLAWTPPGAKLLLFGGDSIRAALERAGREFVPVLLPESERRYLFVVRPAAAATAP